MRTTQCSGLPPCRQVIQNSRRLSLIRYAIEKFDPGEIAIHRVVKPREVPLKRFLILFSVLAAVPLFAQRYEYIIPVWAADLRGGSQVWSSEIYASNGSGGIAIFQVAEVYPGIEEQFCHPVIYCGPQEPRELFAGDTLLITPNFWKQNTIYKLAALRIESDQPIHIESWVRGITDGRIMNQEIAVGREWIPARDKVFIPERYYHLGGGTPDRTNLFVVNPNDSQIEVQYRIVHRGTQRPPDEDRTIVVPPKSLAIAPPITAYRGGDFDLPVYPRIELSADQPFYAVASDTDILGDVAFRGPAR